MENNLFLSENTIDINDKLYYEWDGGDRNDRTRKRLQEIIDLGMVVTGTASFGIKNVMSGLYIEKVWGYDDKQWSDYIGWVKEMKDGK